MQTRSPVLLLLLLLLIGCSSDKNISTQSSSGDPRLDGPFTLYRLDGDRYPGDPVPDGAVLLHHWPILQTCSITEVETREALFKALDNGIDQWNGTPIDCFNPRHAIRVKTNGVNVDYLICFQCRNYQIWEGNKHVSGGMTTQSPKETFERVLDECKKSQ